MTKHLRPLYIKAHIDGKPVSRVLVDNGAAVNILPLRMVRRLSKSEQDLLKFQSPVLMEAWLKRKKSFQWI
jgi:hypothetical protein